MNTSIWTRLTTTALTGCALMALTTPAMGQSSDVVPRRDGSKAVPFVANLNEGRDASSSEIVPRRDGSKAVPFVANVGPETNAATDTFDWADAGIGAGLALLAGLAAMVGVSILRERRPNGLRKSVPRSIGH